MPVTNPRYPHWCRILRKTTEDPMDEEEDFSPLESETPLVKPSFDDDYDPMASDGEEEGIDFEQLSSSSSSSSSSDEEEKIDKGTVLIYEGECRSYEKNTTSDKGEVITSYRGLALPLNQEGWERLGVVPQEGDEIVVVHGIFKEYGRVIDKNVATASFAGTHLVWRYGRA